MPGALTKFEIHGLHHRRNIKVPIKDNLLVLVGENGTGKSTLANFIYFFLTRQWTRLLDYEFQSISAVVDEQLIEVSREDLAHAIRSTDRERWATRFPPSLHRRLRQIITQYSREQLLQRDFLMGIAREYRVPTSALSEFLRDGLSTNDLWSKKIDDIEKKLEAFSGTQFLFLPTYRRIEQDLNAIFPGMEEEVEHIRENVKRRSGNLGYIELVEFGMEDVDRIIRFKMEQIKDNVRTGLNALTGTYLRDVIQGAYKSFQLQAKLRDLDQSTIDVIFGRIPSGLLTNNEYSRLRDIVNKVRETDSIDHDDRVVAHFLTKLIELHQLQQDDEKDVREFVRVCGEYLSGKIIEYDNLKYEIKITQTTISGPTQELSMKMLSSGEKQIVSLFSHIYLSSPKAYFVIIDEPELSLSVPWQRRFLPDILQSGRCKGLVSVTHSPFIYENQLDGFVLSLEDFIG